ncbi:unnamed protein product, partial [marine sediment metagenome]
DFQNRSFRPEIDWVGMGLAYLVRGHLGELDGVEVLPDRKQMSNGSGPRPDWTVTGEVRESGTKLMVTVSVDHQGMPEDRKQLLTEGDERDLFAMAEYIAERISHHLRLEFTASDRVRLDHGMTRDIGAFKAFAAALTERRLRTKVELYQRAVSLDPSFAIVYRHLSRIYTIMREYRAAESALVRFLSLESGSAEAYNDYAYVLAQLGRHQEAGEQYRLAVEMDPMSARYRLNLADTLRHQERREEARQAYRDVLA